MYNLLTFSLNGGIFGLHSFCVPFCHLVANLLLVRQLQWMSVYVLLRIFFCVFFVVVARSFVRYFAAFILFSRSFYPILFCGTRVCSRLVFHFTHFENDGREVKKKSNQHHRQHGFSLCYRPLIREPIGSVLLFSIHIIFERDRQQKANMVYCALDSNQTKPNIKIVFVLDDRPRSMGRRDTKSSTSLLFRRAHCDGR